MFAGTVAVFLPLARYGFLGYDDPLYITGNFHVQAGLRWNSVVWAFTSFDAANWHPLTWLSHMLDAQLFGLHAAGHHLTNIFIHALNAALLFWLLWKATGKRGRALVVAAIFAAHPLAVESVAWIAERKNLLSTLFGLGALAAYGWYARKPGSKRYLFVAILFAASLMSKPMLVTLPFVMLLLDYWPLQRLRTDPVTGAGEKSFTSAALSLLLEKLPLLALSAASSAVTLAAQQHEGAINPAAFPLALRLENALLSYVAYLGKIFWPARLAISYPHIRSAAPIAAVIAAIALVLITALALRRRQSQPYLLVGWLWFLGTLVPVIGLVQVGDQARADRYMYVPMIGIIVAAVWLLAAICDPWPRARRALPLIAAVCICALTAATLRQERYWRDDVTLFSHALAVDPENNGAHDALGFAIAEGGGDLELARAHFETALRIYPHDPLAFAGLGYYFNAKGDLAQAAPEFRLALANTRSRSVRAQMRNNLGALEVKRGDLEAAKLEYEQSVLAMPDRSRPWADLGFIAFDQKQFDEAIADFQKSIAINANAGAYLGLARALHVERRDQEAIAAYLNALALAPGLELARKEMRALQSQGGKPGSGTTR